MKLRQTDSSKLCRNFPASAFVITICWKWINMHIWNCQFVLHGLWKRLWIHFSFSGRWKLLSEFASDFGLTIFFQHLIEFLTNFKWNTTISRKWINMHLYESWSCSSLWTIGKIMNIYIFFRICFRVGENYFPSNKNYFSTLD